MDNKNQIVVWVNSLIKTKVIQIANFEQLNTGVALCELVNILHPGKMDLSKVFIKPKSDYEIQQNFKLLNNSMKKLGMKNIDVNKLSKGRPNDIIALVNYIKKQFEDKEQDPLRIRNLLKTQESPLKNARSTMNPIRQSPGRQTARQTMLYKTIVPRKNELERPIKIQTIEKSENEKILQQLELKRSRLVKKLAKIQTVVQSHDNPNLQQLKQILLRIIQQ